MRIRIEKINYGVTFVPVTKSGKPASGPMGRAVRNALSLAEEWYRAEVTKAFDEANLSRCGYALDFARVYAKTPEDHDRRGRRTPASEGAYMALEPVGFAISRPDGEITMNDTGSTATSGRAKVLACYQAPLFKLPSDEPDCVWFRRFVNVLDHGVVPEDKPRCTCACRCPWPDEHGECGRCGGRATKRASCAVEA